MIFGLFTYPEAAIFSFKAFLLNAFEDLSFNLNEYVLSGLLTSCSDSLLFSSFISNDNASSALDRKYYFFIFF